MASTAITSQNTRFYVETATASTKTVTGITKAASAVVTSAAHGLSTGATVVFASVAGMTEINGRAAVITAVTTGTFTCNIDSTNFTAYTSGGTADVKTMTEIENVKSFAQNGTAAAEIDVTNLASTVRERLAGIADRGSITLEVDIDNSGAGQAALRGYVGNGVGKALKVVDSASKSFAMMIAWSNFAHSVGIDAAKTGTFEGYTRSDFAWYA